jgi:hypothetical protein
MVFSLSLLLAEAETLFRKHSKIMITTETEDTNSVFETIYLFNKKGKIVYLIHTWNGGHSHFPIIEEFYLKGERFWLKRSYTLEIEKPESLARVILCDRALTRKKIDPTHDAVTGFSQAEVEDDVRLQEPRLFDGC